MDRLSDRKFSDLADQLSGFTFSSLQGFGQIYDILIKYGHTPDELKKYVEENKEARQSGIDFAKDYLQGPAKYRRCPKCNGFMLLEAVNTCSGNVLPDKKYKSVYTCSMYKECGYQEFSRNSVAKEMYLFFKKNNVFEKYRPKRKDLHEHRIRDSEEMLRSQFSK